MLFNDKFGEKAVRNGNETIWIYTDNWEMGREYKCVCCGCGIDIAHELNNFLPRQCPNCGKTW